MAYSSSRDRGRERTLWGFPEEGRVNGVVQLLQQSHCSPAAGGLLGGGDALSNGMPSATVHCLAEPATAPPMHSFVNDMAQCTG